MLVRRSKLEPQGGVALRRNYKCCDGREGRKAHATERNGGREKRGRTLEATQVPEDADAGFPVKWFSYSGN